MRRAHPARRAATLVEAAVILAVFLTLVLGMLDLGIGVMRYNSISAAARQGARQAIVHGSRASALGSWGPATLGPVAGTDSAPLVQAMQTHLAHLGPATVTVQAGWLDGGNDPNQRVRVTVTTTYQPILPSLLGFGAISLAAAATMPIAH